MSAPIYPPHLKTMADVRRAIDDVDSRIVPLLLERLSYINAAGHIKTDRSQVRDTDRVQDVLDKVAEISDTSKGDTVYITDIYRHLIEYSINHEFAVYDSAIDD